MYDVDLKNFSAVEIVDLIEQADDYDRQIIFRSLPPDTATTVFEFLPFHFQKNFLDALPVEDSAKLLNNLSPDDRTAFLEELPSKILKELLKLLSPTERIVTLQLLGYPENSVGRLMTTDYISIKLNWTVGDVLEHIRKFGHYSETISVLYVIDDQGVLIDDILLKDFLFAQPEAKVSTLSDYKVISVNATDDQEIASSAFQNYNRNALPVIDDKGVLLGIVTIDDILMVVEEETTEDIQKIGGSAALDAPYMATPFFELMQKRVGWLSVLFLGQTLTASAMAFYQVEIEKAVVLTLFLPLVISSGGNSGSQASTLIIRALALGEVTIKDWWKIMQREIYAGIFLGLVLGFIGFLRIAVWGHFSDMYGLHSTLIAICVGVTLVGIVLWGTITGSMLPIILKSLGFDPATSSAPFVATLVDVTGVIIYFTISYFILQGTML